MSNTSKGRASKGSKCMMQMAASPLQKFVLDSKLDDELIWLSPVEDTDFEEYQISNKKVCEFLGLTTDKMTFNFWPSRQPQWDGIAIGRESGTLYLFEAKSDLQETKTDCSASSDASCEMIAKTMWELAQKVYNMTDDEVFNRYWMKNNYQLANRLTFLQKMKELSANAKFYDQVKLVLLNFVKDPTLEEEHVLLPFVWSKHYDWIFDKMHITRMQVEEQGLIILNYSAPYIY